MTIDHDRTLTVSEKVTLLEDYADEECSHEDNEDCKFCEARRLLNEIGELISSWVIQVE
jgi:hypothetical protein